MKEFPHYTAMPIQDVMANPSKYIIPENLRSIEYLWNMNILTTQTNDYENNDSFIAIGMLSKENAEVFNEMLNDMEYRKPGCPGMLMQYGNGFIVPVKPGTKDPFEDFLPLFNKLQMQDVQRDGYLTIDEFYSRYTDCWKLIRNPYLGLEPSPYDYKDNIQEFIRVHGEFLRKKYPRTPWIGVYDETKATKSLEEYLADAGLLDCYDAEEQKIFLNRRLYEGHMLYKNIVQKQESESPKPHTR